MRRTLLVLIIILTSIPQAFAQMPKHLELSDVIVNFLLDVQEKRTEPFCDFHSENDDITWLTFGVADVGNYIKTRTGLAYISVKSKKFYTLEQRKKYLPWGIEMFGDKFGVKYVALKPDKDTWGGANSGSDFELEEAMLGSVANITKVCELAEYSERAVGYAVTTPNKQDATLLFTQTCGSGGCANNVTIVYRKLSHEEMQGFLSAFNPHFTDNHKF